MMLVKRYKRSFTWLTGFVVIGFALLGLVVATVRAAQPASDFSLQVAPSPLIATVKPGQTTTLELNVRNTGTGTEELRIEPRKFTVDRGTGQVSLDDTAPAEAAQWVSFASPRFSIKPGEWFTQKVHIALPKESGFSYSFALIISRTNNPQSVESGRLIKGSVAIFTLLNVDRPGATRKLEVEKFTTSEAIYEYLPAKLNIQFKNTGNTIVQPYGNIFIQRGSDDAEPISTLPVNDKRGYILPGSVRTLDTSWDKGFPVPQTVTGADDGQQKQNQAWDWSKLSDFRIGRYTAKLVAVYNDGQRDIPIVQEVSFWVVPWRILLGATVVIVIFGFGLWSVVRKVLPVFKLGKRHRKP